MTDKMPDVIYAIPDCDQPVSEVWSKENVWTTSTTYIRQDSINVPDELDLAISVTDENLKDCDEDEIPAPFTVLLNAARELQRIKGLK